MSTRASNSALEPGHHSVERAKPVALPNGGYRLRWRVRLWDGTVLDRTTKAPTKGEVRRRARAAAERCLESNGERAGWTRSSITADYVKKVTLPAIASASLEPRSRYNYQRAVDLALGTCTQHRHQHSIAKLPLASLTFRALESCLLEIAKLHGEQTAKQARAVLSKYLMQQLMRDEIIDGNPLQGTSIDLKSKARPVAPRAGGQAFTREEWLRIVDHLLDMDPAEGVVVRSRGRLEQAVAKRACVRDLTMLQAATGLRISEANQIEWADMTVSADGHVSFDVREEISKTKRGRKVPILDDRVSERMLARRNERGGRYVIGSPSNPDLVWDGSNRAHTVKEFYLGLHDELRIPLLKFARSHVWRATLNSILIEVPEVVRAAHFGHDTAVNRASYTDLRDMSPLLVTAGKRLRAV